MNNQNKLDTIYNNHYPQWLGDYQDALKSEAKEFADKFAKKTGDPMADYKAREELALCYKYS